MEKENNKIVSEILSDEVFLSLEAITTDKYMDGTKSEYESARKNTIDYLVTKYIKPMRRGTEISIESIKSTFLLSSRFVEGYDKQLALDTMNEIAVLQRELDLCGYKLHDDNDCIEY